MLVAGAVEVEWEPGFNFEDKEDSKDFFAGLCSLALEGDLDLPNSSEDDLDLFVGVVGVEVEFGLEFKADAGLETNAEAGGAGSIGEEIDLWEDELAEKASGTDVSLFEGEVEEWGEEECIMEVSIFKPLPMFAGEADLREDLMGKSEREFAETAEFKLTLELFTDFLVLGIGIATGAEFGCAAE